MPRYARLLACFLFFLCTVLPIGAQTPASTQRQMLYRGLEQLGHALPHDQAPPLRAAAQNPGSIRGFLTLAADSAAADLPAVLAIETSLGLTYEATFLDDGSYFIADVEPGSYHVLAFYDDAFPTYFPGVVRQAEAEAVVVGDGEAVVAIDFSMVPQGTSASGTLSGRVRAEEDATLVRGQVVATRADSPFFSLRTAIAADGTYELTAPIGAYIVRAHAEGYLPQFYADARTYEAATPVTVEEQTATAGIDFTLQLGGVLSGRVTDESGQPLADVELLAFTSDRPDTGADTLGAVFATAQTDADGRYTFSGLHEVPYRILATYSFGGFAFNTWYDGAASFATATPITPTFGAPQTNIDFALDLPEGYGSLSGRARFRDGTPVSRGVVRLTVPGASDLFSSPSAQAYVQEDGTYRFESVPEGRYTVSLITAVGTSRLVQWYDGTTSADDATPVAVHVDAETSGIDFTVSLGATIGGAVRNQRGEPLADTELVAYKVEGSRTDADAPVYTTTAADGTYRFVGLDEGAAYHILARVWTPFFSKTLWYDNAMRAEDATPVVALEEGPTTIDFTFDDPNTFGQITGTVTYADGSAAANIAVGLAPASHLVTDADSTSPSFDYFVFTQADGTYEMPDVPVGAYILYAQLETDAAYRIIWYGGASSASDATIVTVLEGQVTADIDFVLPAVDGTLSGTVADRDGQPLARASVSVQPADGRGRGFYYGRAETDSSGAFTFRGLPDGAYYVHAYACSGWQCGGQWWPNAEQRNNAQPITLTDGVASSSPAFVLDVAAGTSSISGQLTDQATGQPLSGAYVSLTSEDRNGQRGLSISAYAVSDSSGGYHIGDLPAGTYFVHASYWQDRASDQQWYDGASSFDDATPVAVGEAEAMSRIDFDLDVRPRYGMLSGTVRHAVTGQPFARAYVEVSPLDMPSASARATQALFAPTYNQFAMVDAQGRFEIDWLYEGAYIVTVYTDQGFAYYGDTQIAAEAEPITITGGDRTTLAVALAPEPAGDGVITGRVDGGWEAAVVMAKSASNPSASPSYATLTAEGGAYTLDGLPDGDYYVMAFMPFSIMQYYNGVYDPAEATVVSVTAGTPITAIDFKLDWIFLWGDASERTPTTGGTTVYGTVTNADGQALADATVFAVDADGAVLASARVHANGTYRLEGIPAGSSYRFKASALGYASRYHDGSTEHDAATPVETGNGQLEFSFTLDRASQSVSTEAPGELPTTLTLEGNYPNPFNPSTQIVFSLPEAMAIRLTVFNTLGQQVQTLYDGTLPAGRQRLTWTATSNGPELPSGLYFYRLEGAGQTLTGTMLLLR